MTKGTWKLSVLHYNDRGDLLRETVPDLTKQAATTRANTACTKGLWTENERGIRTLTPAHRVKSAWIEDEGAKDEAVTGAFERSDDERTDAAAH